MACTFLVVAFWAVAATAQTQADFFDDTLVQEIRLDLKASDWATLKENYLEDTYYTTNFKWRDVLVGDVAIRSRGTGSRSPVKPGLMVDFNRNEPDQTFLGLKSVILRNNTQESSTQFVLYSGSAAQAASGTLRFVSQSGQPLSLLIW